MTQITFSDTVSSYLNTIEVFMSNQNICRETIAKLMANENITVTHLPSATTASFDVKNRILILPVWNESEDSVYTLLISHEVGHALFTPIEQVMSILNTQPHLKIIINIVEDARIEKLIQAKYPGIKYQFKKGYSELFKNNFFNTDGRSVDSYNLLDRLNIHFKVGGFGYYSVPFSLDEQQWIERIDSCKTFSDVINTSKDLYEYLKSEQDKISESQKNDLKATSDSDSKDSESNSQPEKSNPIESDTQSTQVSNEMQDEPNPETYNNEQFNSETQNSFESNVSNRMVDRCHSYHKLNVPKIDLNDVIVSYKEIHAKINEFYEKKQNSVYPYGFNNINLSKAQEFKRKFSMSVNSMANIFEIKKKASLYSRTTIAKTGQLDMNKIHSYRYNDNIFKKISVVPEGKSHGLVMFFDMSSSMDKVISSCIEQILILCMFCKKINIPFEVYGFSDTAIYYTSNIEYYGKIDELKISKSFKLRNYLSSKMSNVEYESAFFNMIRLSENYDQYFSFIPPDDRLGSTPLIPCILTSKTIISKFKSDYNLDIVNAIYLTDGDDTHGIISDVHHTKLNSYYNSCKIVIKSNKTGKEYVVKSPNDTAFNFVTDNMLKMVKDETNANIISFYLVHGSLERLRHLMKLGRDRQKVEQFYKSNNFYEIKNHLGYDSFYFIRSSSLNVSNSRSFDELDADIDYADEKQLKQNIKKIAKSFDKHMTLAVKNKMFLNKFIEQIA